MTELLFDTGLVNLEHRYAAYWADIATLYDGAGAIKDAGDGTYIYYQGTPIEIAALAKNGDEEPCIEILGFNPVGTPNACLLSEVHITVLSGAITLIVDGKGQTMNVGTAFSSLVIAANDLAPGSGGTYYLV